MPSDTSTSVRWKSITLRTKLGRSECRLTAYAAPKDALKRAFDTGGEGSSPFDLAVSRDGHFLYNLASGSDSIVAFMLHADGSLTPAGSATGLPASEAGLATG